MKAYGSTIALAAALFAPVKASRQPVLPRATASVDPAVDGWSPKPTAPPGGLTELRRRQSDDAEEDGTTALVAPDNTCGFVSGRPGAQYTCAGDYSCVFFTATSRYNGYVGCCDSANCGIRLDCVDYEQLASSSVCDDGCLVDAFTLKCSNSGMPYCNTISFTSNIYDYFCNSVSISTAQSATTAYSGLDRSFSPLALDVSTTESFLATESSADDSSTRSNESESATATSTSDSGGDDGDSSDNSDKDNGDKKKDGGSSTPIGAIVGGVVGGVAVIGLGLLGLWLIFRNKKKRKAAAAAEASSSPSSGYPPVAQTGPHGGPPGVVPVAGQPGSHQSYHDPKFMAAGQQYQQYPQQPQQQQGGFYPVGTGSPPPPQSSVSPSMSYADPNSAVSPNGTSPNMSAYPSGFAAAGHPSPPSGGNSQGGFIAEAPSRPDETHRGGVHEMA